MDCSLPDEYDQVQDILRIMRQQEATIYRRTNEDGVDELKALWRRLLIEWMYFVVDYCNLRRDSVAAAAFFLDTAVSKDLVKTREEHQLAAATALQLALKTFDTASIKLERLVKLGRGLFTEADIVRMECRILQALDWRLHPTTSYCFLRQFERLLPSTVSETAHLMIGEVTKLASELTATEQKYNQFPPSVVAYAGMLVAMELIDHTDIPICQRHCFVINMATIANLESKSSLVLEAFDELKQSLDTSSKLEEVVEAIAAAQIKKSKSTIDLNSIVQSPRHVMARIHPC
jgi:hypothetical protein